MSLINQMLNDLESRQARLDESSNSVLDGLQFSDVHEDEKDYARPRLLFVIFVIILAGVMVYTMLKITNPGKFSEEKPLEVLSGFSDENQPPTSGDFESRITPLSGENPGSEQVGGDDRVENFIATDGDKDMGSVSRVWSKQSPLPMLSLDSVIRVATAEEDYSGPAQKEQTTEIMDLAMLESEFGFAIDLELTADPQYSLFTLESPPRLVIELENSQPVDSEFLQSAGMQSVSIRTRNENDRYQVIFEFERAVEIQDTRVVDSDNGKSLHIELLDVDAASVAAEVQNNESFIDETASAGMNEPEVVLDRPRLDKNVIKQDMVRKSRDLRDEAMAAYREGDIISAIDKLYTAVSSDANNHRARESLAEILIEQGDTDAARKLLVDGLERKPNHTHMAQLLAQILATEKNNRLALFYLERALPDVRENPDYHAFVAALLQREERHKEAIIFYRNVLNVNADNGIWWMGLGISLEATGAGQMALGAYQRARKDSNLSASVARYLDTRINELYKPQNS